MAKNTNENLTLQDKIGLYLQTEWDRGSAIYLWAIWIVLFFWIITGVQKSDVLPFFPYKLVGYGLLFFVPFIIYRFIRMFMAAPKEGNVYIFGIIPMPKPILFVVGGIAVCFFVLVMAVPLVVVLRNY